MSGIYGIWHPSATLTDYTTDIKKLCAWNKAYGKHSESTYINASAFIGCSYEKLADSAPTSSPVLHSNHTYTVIDALLYNREELIQKGDFSDKLSDEELLFAYIEKFGFDALKDVNGDFAGAIYNDTNNILTLFRDHMGIRPLFYYATEHSISFSTDIRGLTAMESVDISVDETWLWSKLSSGAYLGTENTEFSHIFCVKPASYLCFHLTKDQLHSCASSYWQLGAKKIHLSSDNAYIEQLRNLIFDSIKRRLDAISGPVGAELSGGLDSSIIDILIHRFNREAIYFSWSASPEDLPYAEDDERLIVEDICKQEHISCHYRGKRVYFEEDSIIHQKMRDIGIDPDMNAGFFRRYVFPPYINTLQICQSAQYVNTCGAKAVFTGHSGDEGVSHRCNPYELFYHGEYLHYIQYMWDSTQGEKNRFYHTLKKCYRNLTTTRKKLTESFVSVFASKDMLKQDFYEKYRTTKSIPVTFAYDPLSYIRNGGSRNRLDVIALLGAYCGARYIVPYLDYRVIDYAVSIPRHLYLKHQKNRYIFREAFKDIMPESLYQLSGKEDTSWRNVESTPTDASSYLERKIRLFNMLDRSYWDNYLNWEFLEQWANTPYTSTDEMRDCAIFTGIDNCLSLQNMITFSRSINP